MASSTNISYRAQHAIRQCASTSAKAPRQVSRHAIPSSTPSRSYQRRCLATVSSPVYLDFLAPAWQSPVLSTRRTCLPNPSQRRPSPRSVQQRGISQSIALRAVAAAAPAKPVVNPRTDESGNEMTIAITPRAAHRLSAISQSDQNPHLALRVTVESGGCHGFQYLMSLTSTEELDAEEDTLFENPDSVGAGVGSGYKAKVVMDEPSLELLKGSSIDYTMELIGSQFKVTGIPGAKSSCGCGTSFDIA
ncbi:hypothetical protein K431DRAFT_281971 [Polychaeton citri CBS 116435]|uniref:Core domain-containing protein n=1 Tax=Polychaeton citri CBS 116435 TaxID=1314669 RepID=A0A9P4UQH4_9PEZI|nr:hypothetical protein K431DRAFT_281971 [Polychaeton citri CBS 116435]